MQCDIHCNAFNHLAFNHDTTGGLGLVNKITRPRSKHDEVICIVCQWEKYQAQEGDKDIEKDFGAFKKQNKVGYDLVKRFTTDIVELPTGEKQVVLCKKEGGKQGRIVLCEEDIFDGIDEFHGKHGGYQTNVDCMFCQVLWHHANALQIFCRDLCCLHREESCCSSSNWSKKTYLVSCIL